MYRACVVTVSDSSFYEGKKDLSGPEIVKVLKNNDYEIVDVKIVADEKEDIKRLLEDLADNNRADLVITSGGTGFNKRDVTPEATMEIIEKYTPGFGELMRMKSYEINKNAILSRACSGIRKDTLIINLPGSPRGAVENLNFIIGSIEHGLKMLLTSKNDCGNMNDKR
ncbi:MAG: MogA/MoaB family molybdenum cofactor biosynthesis protein [Peptoniphilaceae bacterium]